MRRPPAFIVVLMALLASAAGGRVSAQPSSPQGVKAAFVFNVLNFVEWPAPSLPAGPAPLRVALLASAAQPEFAAALHGKVVRGHPLTVETFDSIERIDSQHVVFITADQMVQIRPLLKRVNGRPVLTIAEQNPADPIESVMAIGVLQAKLAFGVNLDVADSIGLQVNPNLLKLAKQVVGRRARAR